MCNFLQQECRILQPATRVDFLTWRETPGRNYSEENSMQRIARLLGVTAALLLVSSLAFGQAISGDLVGTVTDKSGAVVPNATVTATNEATNVKASTTTNSSGEYRFSNL